MGFRFRKSIPLFKGARVNLSRGGVGFSFGIPGTGLSWGYSPRRRKARPDEVPAGCGCLLILFCGLAFACVGSWLTGPRGGGGSDWRTEQAHAARLAHSRSLNGETFPPLYVSPPTPVHAWRDGDEVVLAQPRNSGKTILSRDESTAVMLSDLNMANVETFKRIEREGGAWRVPNGTRARVTGWTARSCFVEIEEGGDVIVSGWACPEHLVSPRAPDPLRN